MYPRSLDFSKYLKQRSIFLLGPRQTGKSTLLKQRFPEAKYVNLLEADTYRRLSKSPESLRLGLDSRTELIVIDEVQKLPELLDEVQLLIDTNPRMRFILTGSSARKLKAGKANLLGGRALSMSMHPLVSEEIPGRVLERINRSSLPFILDSEFAEQDLNSYVGVYLKEEIQGEGLTRSIGNFSRVLEVAALSNTQIVNYSKIGNDAQVSPRTVRDYFDILSDTLLIYLVPPFQKTPSRKAIASPKLYFFDVGVARALRNEKSVDENSAWFGGYLEQLVYLEMKAYIDYHLKTNRIYFWRSLSQLEVDFVIDDHTAIEVKASKFIHPKDYKNMFALEEDLKLQKKIVVCRDKTHVRDDGVHIYHYDDFFRALWTGVIF